MKPSPLLYLQLHSLRREAATDAEGTLHGVSALGFDGVELASDFGWPADRWRALLAETGLLPLGAMYPLETLETDLAGRMEFCRALGMNRIVVSRLPREMMHLAGYHDSAGRLNALGSELAKHGFLFAYHNHAWELEPLPEGGGCGLDILMAETDPALLRFEFDTYWLEFGGQDAAQYLRQHAARTLQIHAKDFRQLDRQDVPAGEGDVDFSAVIPFCLSNDWPVILEYESEDAPAAVRQGAAHLRSLFPR